jgi:hypothetical protein
MRSRPPLMGQCRGVQIVFSFRKGLGGAPGSSRWRMSALSVSMNELGRLALSHHFHQLQLRNYRNLDRSADAWRSAIARHTRTSRSIQPASSRTHEHKSGTQLGREMMVLEQVRTAAPGDWRPEPVASRTGRSLHGAARQ